MKLLRPTQSESAFRKFETLMLAALDKPIELSLTSNAYGQWTCTPHTFVQRFGEAKSGFLHMRYQSPLLEPLQYQKVTSMHAVPLTENRVLIKPRWMEFAYAVELANRPVEPTKQVDLEKSHEETKQALIDDARLRFKLTQRLDEQMALDLVIQCTWAGMNLARFDSTNVYICSMYDEQRMAYILEEIEKPNFGGLGLDKHLVIVTFKSVDERETIESQFKGHLKRDWPWMDWEMGFIHIVKDCENVS